METSSPSINNITKLTENLNRLNLSVQKNRSNTKNNKKELNINSVNFFGRSLLVRESMKNKNSVNFDKIINFIKNGININLVDAFGWTALMYAVEKNNIELVKLLLQFGADKFVTAMVYGAYKSKIERTLINFSPNRAGSRTIVNRYGTAYDIAKKLDRRNIKKILIE
jgi:ankyrin repeat protein